MKTQLSRHLRRALSIFATLAAVLVTASPARADLATDLGALETRAGALQTAIANVNGTASTMCGPLAAVNQMSRDLADETTRIDESLAAPLSVDQATWDTLSRLSAASVALASETARLTADLGGQQTTVDAANLKDGIVAVLQLSDDIGTMADRIGEMADKILVMSDNIGLMADRIVVTQEIQSQNLQLTEATLLQTQTNALTLVSVVEDATYDLSLSNLVSQGNLLAARMAAIVLSPWTMAKTLSSVAGDVRALRDQVDALRRTMVADTSASTVSISTATLSQLISMTVMIASVQTAVDGYAIALSALQGATSTSTLTASLTSMLQVSADIGVMANRILEMADQILAMADNIGLEADQILATQQTASLNVASTQARILAVQELAVTLIALRTQ